MYKNVSRYAWPIKEVRAVELTCLLNECGGLGRDVRDIQPGFGD